jgi:starvation-inducible DNA-binding protein
MQIARTETAAILAARTLRSSSNKEIEAMNIRAAIPAERGAVPVPSGIDLEAVANIAETLTTLSADLFALYIKTKNFHWHVSGPHFRDYHLLFDEQSEQLLAATDGMAERVRKLGGVTLHSVGQIARLTRIADNDEPAVPAPRMLEELAEDNAQLARGLRGAHALCDEFGDVASASLIENWIDETERRIWFLCETIRRDLDR